MRFDSGEITFYAKRNSAQNGLRPAASYAELLTCCYAELTVGVSRYNQAKQNDAQIDMLVRIPRTFALRTEYAATIEPYSHEGSDEIFTIYQIQQTSDEDGLPVTDISLERNEGIDAGQIESNSDSAG